MGVSKLSAKVCFCFFFKVNYKFKFRIQRNQSIFVGQNQVLISLWYA